MSEQAFQQAGQRIFARLASSGVYHPAGGTDVEIGLIRSQPTESTSLFSTQISSASTSFWILASAVPEPKAGDTITIGSRTFVVQGEPELDQLGVSWHLDTVPS